MITTATSTNSTETVTCDTTDTDTVVCHDSRTLQETVADSCTQAELTAIYSGTSYPTSLQPREDIHRTTTQPHFCT